MCEGAVAVETVAGIPTMTNDLIEHLCHRALSTRTDNSDPTIETVRATAEGKGVETAVVAALAEQSSRFHY